MNIQSEKYIIVEIIPTASTKEKGKIAQISALKIDGLQLIDRFDYRLKKEHIEIPQILEIISYDEDKFTYVEEKDLLNAFQDFTEGLPLLILDNAYTKDYLTYLTNKKISICDILNVKYHDHIIDELIEKYHLEPSNYIVDLLYESILKSDF